MNLSQKCQYAVRSMLELAKHYGKGPLRISAIAEKQSIPARFLENILNELRSTGLIESRRGAQGGYILTKDPGEITVGDIIRLVDGPLDPVKCTEDKNISSCPLRSQCSLIDLWSRAKAAVEEVYDSVTFKELAEQEEKIRLSETSNYSI